MAVPVPEVFDTEPTGRHKPRVGIDRIRGTSEARDTIHLGKIIESCFVAVAIEQQKTEA